MVKPILIFSFDQLSEEIKIKLRNEFDNAVINNYGIVFTNKQIYDNLKKFKYYEDGKIV